MSLFRLFRDFRLILDSARQSLRLESHYFQTLRYSGILWGISLCVFFGFMVVGVGMMVRDDFKGGQLESNVYVQLGSQNLIGDFRGTCNLIIFIHVNI